MALTQTSQVAAQLRNRYPKMDIEIVMIRTSGDILKNSPLAKIGGKGLFIKEIEEALLAGAVDLAVHSMKDLPAELPEGLQIAAVPLREDPRDVLISRNGLGIADLPQGARVGTGSLRRIVQLKNWRPDLEILPIRGNLDTRIRKVEAELDGIVVAAAGIRRMGWTEKVSQFIEPERMLPAVGQGVLCLETRVEDDDLKAGLAFLENERTRAEVTAERAFLRRLGGGCTLPVAAFAERKGEDLVIRGMVGSLKNRKMIHHECRGEVERAIELGTELADYLLEEGGKALLEIEEDRR